MSLGDFQKSYSARLSKCLRRYLDFESQRKSGQQEATFNRPSLLASDRVSGQEARVVWQLDSVSR